jgi:hypothetical protein
MTERKWLVILIGILALCAVVIIMVLPSATRIMDFSDGFGFGHGEIEGRRQLHQAELRLQYGQLRMAGRQALAGMRLLVDSEIRWNSARPYLERSRSLCRQGMYTEAYDACEIAKGLLIGYHGYTYEYGEIHYECRMIQMDHECTTGSVYSVEEP